MFSQPFHPLNKPVSVSLKEDYESALLADKLGYDELFMGEHITDPFEPVTSSLTFLASLCYTTKNIKLGSGTLNLPNSHPVNVAATISMLDHMTNGRIIMGISLGALPTDWESFNVLDKNKEEMFLEAISQILALWSTSAPYELNGKYWQISTKRTMDEELQSGRILKPFQKNGPEIVCSVLMPESKGIMKAAQRGWSPMSSNFITSQSLLQHKKNYLLGSNDDNEIELLSKWRVARMIFVSDSKKDALDYAKSKEGPYAKCIEHILKKMKKAGKLDVFKKSKEQSDSEITIDYCLDELVIAGNTSEVADQIVDLRSKIGPFGTLLNVGIDWENVELAKRSINLLKTEVLKLVI